MAADWAEAQLSARVAAATPRVPLAQPVLPRGEEAVGGAGASESERDLLLLPNGSVADAAESSTPSTVTPQASLGSTPRSGGEGAGAPTASVALPLQTRPLLQTEQSSRSKSADKWLARSALTSREPLQDNKPRHLRDLEARRPASARARKDRPGAGRPASPGRRPSSRAAHSCLAPPRSAAAADATATLARSLPIARKQQSTPGVPHSIARPAAVAAASELDAPSSRGARSARSVSAAEPAEAGDGDNEPAAPYGFPFCATAEHDELGFPRPTPPAAPPAAAAPSAAAALDALASPAARPPSSDRAATPATAPTALARIAASSAAAPSSQASSGGGGGDGLAALGDVMGGWASAASVAAGGVLGGAGELAAGIGTDVRNGWEGFQRQLRGAAAAGAAAAAPAAAAAAAPAAAGGWQQLFGRSAPTSHADEWRRVLGLPPAASSGAGAAAAAAAAAATEGWSPLPPPLSVDARVRRLIGRGVPTSLRGRVWFGLMRAALEKRPDSGALRAALDDDGYYELLLRRRGRSTHAEVQRLIKTDARRTFAEHRHAKRLQLSLRRLLDAYSHRNPAVGYCQSMNFLAGCLLLHMPEECAFWAFCCLVELVLPDGFHSARLHGVTVELRLLTDLLSRQHGALLSHLRLAGVGVEMAASRWLMCLFVAVVPLPTAMRIWDSMMLDAAAKGGPSAVPLLGCLGLLRLHEARLLATPPHSHALLPLLVSLPAIGSAQQHALLVESVARFGGAGDLLHEQVGPLRAAHSRVVEAELLLREASERDEDAAREAAREAAAGGGANGEGGEGGECSLRSEASSNDSGRRSNDSGRPLTSLGVLARAADVDADAMAAAPAGSARARGGGAGWLREQAALLHREGAVLMEAALR